MRTVEVIIYVTLLTAFLDALLDKWGIWSKYQAWAANSRYRWAYNLSFCHLCKRFWLSVIISGVFFTIWGLFPGILAVPFLVGGAFQILEK